MKRTLAAVILAVFAGSALAHGGAYRPPPPRHHNGHHHHGTWVAPLIIGGVVGYALSRPSYSSAAPTAYAVPPTAYYPSPEPVPTWAPPPGFHYEQRLDLGCNCWRWFIVSN